MSKSKCSECDQVIDWDGQGGFLWEGLVFCEDHDPESKETNEQDTNQS